MTKTKVRVGISNRKDNTFDFIKNTLNTHINSAPQLFDKNNPIRSDNILKSKNITRICYGSCGDDYKLFALEYANPLANDKVISNLYVYDSISNLWGMYQHNSTGIIDIMIYNNSLIIIHTDGIKVIHYNGILGANEASTINLFTFESEEYADMACINNKLYVLTNKRLLIITNSLSKLHSYTITAINFASSVIPPNGIVRNFNGEDVIMYANNNGIIPFYYKIIANEIYSFVDEMSYNIINAAIFDNRLLVYGDDSLIHIISEIDNKPKPVANDFSVYSGYTWIGDVKYFEGKLWNQFITNTNGNSPKLVFANSINGTDFTSYLVEELDFDITKHTPLTLPISIESTPYGLIFSNQGIMTSSRDFNLYHIQHIEEVCEHSIIDIMHPIDDMCTWRIIIDARQINIYDLNDITVDITNMTNDISFCPRILNIFVTYNINHEIESLSEGKYLVIDISDSITEEESLEIRGKKYIDVNTKDDINVKIRYRTII